jgi:adenine-specific DNA-methyltransferase
MKDVIFFYSSKTNPIWNDPRQPYSLEDEIKLFRKEDSDGRRYTTVPLHAPGETVNGKTG